MIILYFINNADLSILAISRELASHLKVCAGKIIQTWLPEQGYSGKGGRYQEAKIEREPLEEMGLLDDVYSALVDLLN